MYRIYLYKFLSDFWVIVPVIIPLYKSHGMSTVQIMTVQAAYSVSQLLLEIPSGYCSDRFGRRRTLVAAALLMASGLAVYTFLDSFRWFIIAETVLGAAGALRSGTDSAILYDTLKTIRDEQRYKRYEGNAEFWSRVGTALGSISGGVLGAWAALRLPFYVNLGTALLLVGVGFSLREPRRETLPQGSPFREILHAGRQSINSRELLPVMLQMGVIFSCGVSAVWGYFLLYGELGMPLWSHGIMFAVMQTTCAFGARHSDDVERMFGSRRCRVMLCSIGPLFLLVGLVATPLLLPFLVIVHAALWGISTPLLLERIQRHTTSDVRATTLSIGSMIGRIVTILWGLSFGWMVDSFSIRWAFILMGVFSLVAQPVLLIILRGGIGAVNGYRYRRREVTAGG